MSNAFLISTSTISFFFILGMEEVTYHSGSDRAKVQSVLLLTDGLATHGVITMDGILAKMRTIQQPEDHTEKV